MKQVITLNVNGDMHEVLVAPNQTLLEVLRDKLGLTGTKKRMRSRRMRGMFNLVGRTILSVMLDARRRRRGKRDRDNKKVSVKARSILSKNLLLK